MEKVEGLCRYSLNSLKMKHTKCDDIPSFSSKPEQYLLSKVLTKEEVQTLYKVKSRMISVKNNFRNGNSDMWCMTCMVHFETQQHLTYCFPIRQKLSGVVNFSEFSYEDRNGTLTEQENFAKQYTLILKARQDILEARQPPMGTSAQVEGELDT